MSDVLLPPGARPIPNQPDEPAAAAPARPGASPVQDRHAEETLAACAAFSRHAAQAIAARLDPADYYDPRCAAIVHAGAHTAAGAAEGTSDPAWREHQVARAADVDPLVLEQWCRQATVAYDTNGAVTARVSAMAGRRRRIHELLHELDQLGIHSRWDR